MIKKFIDNHKDEIIKKTQELIQIPSVYSKSKDKTKPFGESINQALEYVLKLGKDLGFRTKNIDGYCGYIEFGEGEELIGIIGHLDVVPEGEGWTYPPFSATIFDNRIFGRGAIDDKGPVIASLYAMKAVMDNCEVHKRVRLILGLNEENDWKCIKRYKETEESPSIGFSPDADFPCIYAEKSILSSYIYMNLSNFDALPIKIKDIDCNHNALNVVPKFCSVILEINNNISMNDFISYIKSFISNYSFEIDIYKISEQEIKLTSHGLQAHAAHPDLGKNAISQLILVLNQIFKYYKSTLPLFEFFDKYIGMEYDGKLSNINFEDESGKLTLNVGQFILEDNSLKIGLNLRIPIHTSADIINETFLKYCRLYSNLTYNVASYQPYLYISKEDPLVKTLCHIFNEETNSNTEPIAIGGGTYARAFNNCVSFGANFPGNKDMCHQTDEFISIDNLILSCKIYARAIIELSS